MTYTKAFLSIILIGFTLSSFSQNNGIVVPGKWSTQIFITDVNGQPFQNKYDKYVGSIFLYDDFRLANITLQNDKAFEKVKTKIDLLNQEMVFLSTDGKLGILNNGQVKEIRFIGEPNDSTSKRVFRTGFPKVDVLNPSSFYEVLADGKLMLLKSLMKYAVENKNELSGEVNRLIENAENIYTFKDNQMKRLKKDREVIYDLMADKRTEITSRQRNVHPNLKNIAELINIVKFYNSLF
jgi:hypothetical protein